MFNIDFPYLLEVLLPPQFRLPKITAFMQIILSYLKVIYDEFDAFRTFSLYDINFTGQICYLEKKLQEKFSIPGIFISDGIFIEPTYMSQKIEGNLPVFINNHDEAENIFFLYNTAEITTNPDFIVNVPSAYYDLMTQETFAKMTAIINYYKVFGKQFIILRYE